MSVMRWSNMHVSDVLWHTAIARMCSGRRCSDSVGYASEAEFDAGWLGVGLF